jgi:hypothetical protein
MPAKGRCLVTPQIHYLRRMRGLDDPIRTIEAAQAERRARVLDAVTRRMPVGSAVQHIYTGQTASVVAIIARGDDVWLRLAVRDGEVLSLAGWYTKLALT